ncbi:hypothetical protein TUMSATVNIG1_33250 [Vibrio nigripulchritudo]|uniref:hypothetical protein n=1 Tax=Vibrio nigripulchritudo TaxID=28173 RepID=UPI00190D70F1|nr:hypothetical protein [Vibrio nigripulchritudo]BCL71358.1 hypothetical protein VNTUMSATTG_32950 [Vibrio nigripulchritudo]BDU32716.1 hypothetical protein TUMSATVNIG1_33250 [Vibrio nigripulchritudo]
MKRLSSYEKNQRDKYSKRTWQNSLSRAGKSYNRFKIYSKPVVKGLDSSATSHVFVPEKLCIYVRNAKKIYSNYTETVNFINSLSTVKGKSKVIIDFSKTYQITAPVVLMLYAAIDVIPIEERPKIQIIFSKVKQRVNVLLKVSGFHSLCRGQKLKPDFSGDKALSVVSGVGGKYRDEIVDFIQHRAYKNKMDPDTEWIYGDAVQETINNVRLHAYPEKDERDKKWWLLCEIIDSQLFLTIYDQGIGIPKTVTDRDWFLQSFEAEYPDTYKEILDDVTRIGIEKGVLPSIKHKIMLVKKWTDPQLVYLSMIGDVSGTKKNKHGQGSKSIKALVKSTDQGKLWVYSNEGVYLLENDRDAKDIDAEGKGIAIQLPKALSGTLVQWNINLNENYQCN